MTEQKAVLKIPGDRTWARITTVDDDSVCFDGAEEQARRISHCLPPLMGGDIYAHSEGDLLERDGVMCLRIEDGAGLDNHVEIEFTENTVQKVSVVFDSDHSATGSSGR